MKMIDKRGFQISEQPSWLDRDIRVLEGILAQHEIEVNAIRFYLMDLKTRRLKAQEGVRV